MAHNNYRPNSLRACMRRGMSLMTVFEKLSDENGSPQFGPAIASYVLVPSMTVAMTWKTTFVYTKHLSFVTLPSGRASAYRRSWTSSLLSLRSGGRYLSYRHSLRSARVLFELVLTSLWKEDWEQQTACICSEKLDRFSSPGVTMPKELTWAVFLIEHQRPSLTKKDILTRGKCHLAKGPPRSLRRLGLRLTCRFRTQRDFVRRSDTREARGAKMKFWTFELQIHRVYTSRGSHVKGSR